MIEMHCDGCNRIMGFCNKKRSKTASYATIYKCIDCYFVEIKEIAKK